MRVQCRYYTDPACAVSFGNEPVVRKLMVEFGAHLSWTYVMGGLARDFAAAQVDDTARTGRLGAVYSQQITSWLELAERTEMPLDPLLWTEAPLASSYPVGTIASFSSGGYETFLSVPSSTTTSSSPGTNVGLSLLGQVVSEQATPTPEPSSLVVLGLLGLAQFGAYRLRNRRRGRLAA